MNRQERRKLERKGVNKKVIMDTWSKDNYDRGFSDGMRFVEEAVCIMTAYTLNYKLGFGRKRLTKIMYDIFNNIDSFRTGHLTRDDFDTIKSEMSKLGIKYV